MTQSDQYSPDAPREWSGAQGTPGSRTWAGGGVLTRKPGHRFPAEPAFVFPGQGSQYPGMGRELAAFEPHAGELIGAAEELTGLPVGELMSRADAATIADPQIAQILVFVASSAALSHFEALGVRAAAVAGHSLGEYTALVACGALGWPDAMLLVAARGRAMSAAAAREPGAMAAIVGLAHGRVAGLCDQVCGGAGRVVLANLNSARQAVVSGTLEAVTEVVEKAREAGALRARRLPVGGAYHSPLMASAERELEPLLRAVRLRRPRLPLVSSVTAEPVADIHGYRDDLLRQITRPVLWQRTMTALAEIGAGAFVELGPGKVLTGLGRETVRSAAHRTAAEALRSLPARPLQTTARTSRTSGAF